MYIHLLFQDSAPTEGPSQVFFWGFIMLHRGGAVLRRSWPADNLFMEKLGEKNNGFFNSHLHLAPHCHDGPLE